MLYLALIDMLYLALMGAGVCFVDNVLLMILRATGNG